MGAALTKWARSHSSHEEEEIRAAWIVFMGREVQTVMFSFDEEKRSRLDSIQEQVRGREPDDGLSLAVRYHIYYGGGSDSFMSRYNELVDRDPSSESRLARELEGLTGSFPMDDEEVMGNVREVLAYSAFSEFDTEMQQLLGDGANALKRLHSKFYFSRNDEDAVFASRNVMHYIYADYSMDSPTVRGSGALYDMRDHALGLLVSSDIESSAGNYTKVRSELNRLVSGNLRLTKKKLDLVDDATNEKIVGLLGKAVYVNRSGVAPFLALVEGATSELVVDTFQFQNRAVSDYIYQWMLRKARDGKGVPKLTIRLAMPQTRDTDGSTSFDILGPNLIQLLKFEQLRERLKQEDQARGITGRNWDDLIRVQVATDRHHSKLYFSDKAAIIGSINLTSPVGHNPLQAGANFEMMRVVRNVYENESLEELKKRGNDDDARETLLYRQIRQLKKIGLSGGDPYWMPGRGQVAMGGDIYEHLEATMNLLDEVSDMGALVGGQFAGRKGKAELHVLLDQVMLLQHAEGLYKKTREGEFGRLSDSELDRVTGGRHERYRRLQEKLLRAAVEGRAFIFTDTRNYREGVLDPLMNGGLNRDLLRRHGMDIRSVASLAEGSTTDERIASLSGRLGIERDLALQVLAIASGNIRAVGVPRQHAKAYMLVGRFEGTGRTDYQLAAISAYMGTSNLGPYSLAMRGMGNEYVSHEIGLTLMLGQARDMAGLTTSSQYAMEAKQEYLELQQVFLPHWRSTMHLLGESSIEHPDFLEVKTRSLWEGQADSNQIDALKGRIEEMLGSIEVDKRGIQISNIYDASQSRLVALEVNLDARALAGFGMGHDSIDMRGARMSFRFTVLGGGSLEPLVYAVDQGLVISRSLFVNNTGVDVPVLDRVVPAKSSTKLSSMDSTLSFIGALAGEMYFRSLVSEPLKAFGALDREAQRAMVGSYLSRLAGVKGGSIHDLADRLDADRAIQLGEVFYRRVRYGNEPMRRAAALSAVAYEEREAVLETLVGQLQDLGKMSAQERAIQLMGRGPSILNQLVEMLGSGNYGDLLLDVISHSGSLTYGGSLREGMEKVKTMLLSPFLTFGQHTIYGSHQAHSRMAVRGVSNESRDAVAMAHHSGIARYSIGSLALSYGPTTDLRTRGVLRSIAEGANVGFGVGEGLELLGASLQNVGDISELAIVEGLSVGSIHKRGAIENYLEGLGVLNGENVERLNRIFGSSYEVVTFTFDTAKKAAQIPQRLKNAMGAKPLHDISEMAQYYMEQGLPMGKLGKEYLRALKLRLRMHYNSIGSGLSSAEIEARVNALVDDDMDIGAFFGGHIRRMLSESAAEYVEAQREELQRELMVSDLGTSGIGMELLRVRALRADMYGGAIRGLIGGSRRHGKPVVLVQMAGAYTDYFYANPVFGGEQGMRQGLLEKAEKRVKASMLSTDWQEKLGLQVKEGYVIRMDYKTGSAAIFDERGNYVGPIDSRDQFNVLSGVVENIGISGLPSLADVQATSANRLGEDSVELIMRVSQLRPASTGKYQMIFELSYVRTVKRGGGTRVEGNWAGGLVKAVSVFTRHDDKYSFFGDIVEQLNRKPGGAFTGQLDIRNVFGLLNPSNLKSFVYGHGAELLSDKNLWGGLLAKYEGMGAASQRLAAALLLGFGSSYGGSHQSAIEDNLYRLASGGELGGYFERVAAVTGLMGGANKDRPASAFVKGASWSILQTPVLGAITGEDVMEALHGNGGNLFGKVKAAIEGVGRQATSLGYMRMGSIEHQQAAILLSALDLFDQLSEQGRDMVKLPTDIDVWDDKVRGQLASIMGVPIEDLDDEDRIRALVMAASARAPVVRMYMDLAFSQSKDPIGSGNEGRLEMQHLVKPFLLQADQFAKDKGLSRLRVTISNVFAAIAQSSIYQFADAAALPSHANVVDITDPYTRSPMFKKRMLGIYGTGIHTDQFEVLRRQYSNKQGTGAADLLEKELVRAANGAKNAGRIAELREQIALLEGQLAELGRYYQIFEEKPAGVGISNAIVGAMNHKRFGFVLPELSFEFTESGAVVTVDKTRGFYSYMPSGDDLRLMGAQFGNYVDRIVQSTIVIQGAFAPGGPLDDVLTRISGLQGRSQLVVTAEEVQLLSQFYGHAKGMVDLLEEAAAGTRLQRGLGAKVPFRGGVATAAGSFLVPHGTAVVSKEIMDRSGARVGEGRWAMLVAADRELGALVRMLNGATNSKAVQAHRDLIELKKNFLVGTKYALTEGVSEQGTKYVLGEALKESRKLEAMYGRAVATADLDKRRERLTRLVKGASRRVDRFKNLVIDVRKRGDSFAQLVAITQMEYWVAKGYESLYGVHESNGLGEPDLGQLKLDIDKERLRVALIEGLPLHLVGFTLGNARMVADELKKVQIGHLDLEGPLRGNVVKSQFSDSILKSMWELELGKRKEFLDYKLTRLIEQAERMNADYSDVVGAHVGSEVRQVLESSERGRQANRNQLVHALKEIRVRSRGGHLEVSDTIAEINAAHAMYGDTTTRVLGFRSPPFGSTEPQLQTYALTDLMAVNERAGLIGESHGHLIIQYEEGRNKTLSLLSPIGTHTMNLGDMDGDPYTFILGQSEDLRYAIEAKRDRIKLLELKRGQVSKRILDEMDKEHPHRRMDRVMSLYEQQDKLDREINRKRAEIPRLALKLSELQGHLVRDVARGALSSQLAAYMGINARFLLDGANGGYQDAPIDSDLMFTWLEQGHGLFGGLEDSYKGINVVYSVLNDLLEPDFSRGPLGLATHLKSIDDMRDKAKQLVEGGSERASIYEAMLGNPSVEMAVWGELSAFIASGSGVAPIGEHNYRAALAYHSASAYNAFYGSGVLQSYMAKAGGTSMEMATYEMLTKVFGKAGGDILGKTYNSIVGTLFADSPMLALGHVLTRNDDVRQSVESHIDKLIGEGKLTGDLWTSGRDFTSNVKSAMRASEELQGFMKTVQQLLRDSIKLKDGTDVIEVLRAKVARYEDPGLDDRGRTAVLDEIVRDLGPGPGLRALMRLDDLVKHETVTDDLLGERFGVPVLSTEEKYIRGLLEGANLNPQDNRLVAAYRTARDLEHMVTAFRFDKASKAGVSFMGRFMDGFQRSGSSLSEVLARFTDSDHEQYGEYSRALGSFVRDDVPYEGKVSAFLEKYGEEGLVLFSHIYEQTKEGTRGLFGELGQNLLRFTAFESVRREVIGAMSGKGAAMPPNEVLGPDIMHSDITIAMMNLAASNKLEPSAALMFWESMQKIVQIGGAAPNSKQVLVALLGSMNRFNNGNEHASLLSAQFGALAALGDTEFSVQFKESGVSYEAKYGSVVDYVEEAVQESRVGVESNAMAQFIRSTKESSVGAATVAKQGALITSGKQFSRQMSSGNSQVEAALEQLVEEQVGEAATGKQSRSPSNAIHEVPVLEAGHADTAYKTISRMSSGDAHTAMDAVMPFLLSVLGQVIASGGVDSNVLQDTVGSSLVGLSYTKPMFSGGGGTVGGRIAGLVGSAFKLRTSIGEAGGDVGEGVARLIAREFVFMGVSSMVTPHLTEFFTRNLFGASPLTLDRDYFEGSRNLAGMLSGALVGGAIANLLGGTASAAVGVIARVPAVSWVDTTLDLISVKARRMTDEMFLVESVEYINEEDGNEVEATYSKEPLAFFQEGEGQQFLEVAYEEDSIEVGPVNLFG